MARSVQQSAAEIENFLSAAEQAEFDGPLPDGTVDVSTAAAALRMLASGSGVRAAVDDARKVREAGIGGGHGGPLRSCWKRRPFT